MPISSRFNQRRLGPQAQVVTGAGAALDLLRAPLTIAAARDLPGQPGFPGERHGVFLDGPDRGTRAAFLGPGTAVRERLARGDRPVNAIDAAAKTHDVAYVTAKAGWDHGPQTAEARAAFRGAIDQADEEFIGAMNDPMTESAGKLTAKIARRAMELKSLGEQLGVLPSKVFSGAGSEEELDARNSFLQDCDRKLHYPCHRLRLNKSNEVRGGFLPALAAVIPLITALLPSLAEGAAAALGGLAATAAAKRISGGQAKKLATFEGPPAAALVKKTGALDTPHGRAAAALAMLSPAEQITAMTTLLQKKGLAAFSEEPAASTA